MAMVPLPSLPALRAFAAVAREGSFVRAAAQLHVTASAVSHQIRQLEEQLHTPLLTRARNGSGHSRTAPTAAGEALLRAVEDTLAKLADACEAIRHQAGRPRSSLVASANGSFASLWLAPRLAAFAALHQSVSWTMRAVETVVLRIAVKVEGRLLRDSVMQRFGTRRRRKLPVPSCRGRRLFLPVPFSSSPPPRSQLKFVVPYGSRQTQAPVRSIV